MLIVLVVSEEGKGEGKGGGLKRVGGLINFFLQKEGLIWEGDLINFFLQKGGSLEGAYLRGGLNRGFAINSENFPLKCKLFVASSPSFPTWTNSHLLLSHSPQKITFFCAHAMSWGQTRGFWMVGSTPWILKEFRQPKVWCRFF